MSSTSLCLDCESIDFDSIFTDDPSKSVVQADIQYVSKLRGLPVPGCPLCLFIERMAPSKPSLVNSRGEPNLYLLGFKDYHSTRVSSLEYPLKPRQFSLLCPILGVFWLNSQEVDCFRPEHFKRRKDPNFLACLKADMRCSLSVTGYIAGHPGIYQHHQDPGLRRAHLVGQPELDYRKIEHWLRRCQETHSMCSDPPDGRDKPSHLIDCESLNVEENLANNQYIALSYVWGTNTTEETSTSLRSVWSTVPLTIKDAIHMTPRLGFRYLWVDHHCIPKIKSALESAIPKMGSIYGNARLVLIASAGVDAHNGLPGVSTATRSYQPRVSIGRHMLVSSMMHPVERVRLSTWKTRGWTYQEERSAQRRLYFTEDQVYYECGSSSCAEVDSMIQVWPNYVGTIDHETTASFVESLNFVKSGAKRNHWEHVREVSRRNLTYPLDVLDCILGVLRLPLAGEHKTPGHLQGIPLRAPLATRFPCPGYFAHQLCWQLDGPGCRRAGFPSWSWTGWIGHPVSPPAVYYTSLLAMAHDSLIEIDVQSEASGVCKNLRELYQQNHLDVSYNRSGTHVLQITTMVVEFTLLYLAQANEHLRLPCSRVFPASHSQHTTASQYQEPSSCKLSDAHEAYYAALAIRGGMVYARFLPTIDLGHQHAISRMRGMPMVGLKLFHNLPKAKRQGCPDNKGRLCTPLMLLGVQSSESHSPELSLTTGVMERIGLIDLRELYEQRGTHLKRVDLGTSRIELLWQRGTVRLA